MTEKTESENPTGAGDSVVDEDRRAALARLGRYGAYTAPALLGLLVGTKAYADISGSPR